MDVISLRSGLFNQQKSGFFRGKNKNPDQ